MKFKDILLISDMDNTLINSRFEISNKNKNELNRFTENGGYFTVATGKMVKALEPYIKELPINTPVILYNGAMIYDSISQEVIWTKCLDNQIIDIIREVYDNFSDVGIQIYHSDQIYLVKASEEAEWHIGREKLNPIICDIEDVPFPWIKVILAGKNARLKQVKEYLKDKGSKFRTVFSEHQFLEILEESVSKGNALKQLQKLLGYPGRILRTVSVGDNLNDMELIQYADVGFAVDNAVPELKAVADICCCHHDEDAIAQVIGWIENKKTGI